MVVVFVQTTIKKKTMALNFAAWLWKLTQTRNTMTTSLACCHRSLGIYNIINKKNHNDNKFDLPLLWFRKFMQRKKNTMTNNQAPHHHGLGLCNSRKKTHADDNLNSSLSWLQKHTWWEKNTMTTSQTCCCHGFGFAMLEKNSTRIMSLACHCAGCNSPCDERKTWWR